MTKPRDEWRHFALLISILFLFVVTPVVAVFSPWFVMDVLAALVLVTGSYSLSESQGAFSPLAIVLSGISIIATCLLLVTQLRWTAALSLSFIIVLIVYFCVTILGLCSARCADHAGQDPRRRLRLPPHRLCLDLRLRLGGRTESGSVRRSSSAAHERVCRPDSADALFQFHDADHGRLRRHRAALRHGTVLLPRSRRLARSISPCSWLASSGCTSSMPTVCRRAKGERAANKAKRVPRTNCVSLRIFHPRCASGVVILQICAIVRDVQTIRHLLFPSRT